MERLRDLMKHYFDDVKEAFLKELKHMLDTATYGIREVQIDICVDLHQFQKGAQVMLEMKVLFKLTGDFSDMEKLLESVSQYVFIFTPCKFCWRSSAICYTWCSHSANIRMSVSVSVFGPIHVGHLNSCAGFKSWYESAARKPFS